MSNTSMYISKFIKPILLVSAFIFFNISYLFSQAISNISPGLFPSPKDKYSYEINQIIFEGNEAFSYNELFLVISSRQSKRGIVHDLYQMLYDEGTKNPVTPKTVLRIIKKNIEGLDYEIRYFSAQSVESDVESILSFYNNNGFHFTKVNFTFLPDSINKENVLKFTIEENRQYIIKSVFFDGLEDLAPELIPQIEKFTTFAENTPFSEDDILRRVYSIKNILDNTGYYFNNVQIPYIGIDSLRGLDSVYIKFTLGRRMKFGSISFDDVRNGQPVIVDKLKRVLIEIETDKYYSLDKVKKSSSNLLSLGLFDAVKIDTVKGAWNDDILNLVITTQYKKQIEYGAGLVFNQKQAEQLILNFGLEAEYTDKNLWNSAQNFHPFVNVLLRDVSKYLANFTKPELEYQLGFTYTQPYLFQLMGGNYGFAANPIGSLRRMEGFDLLTINTPFKFPTRLPEHVYMQTLVLELNLEHQNIIGGSTLQLPDNFDELPFGEQNRILQSLQIYSALEKNTDFLTNIGLNINISRDTRNSPFSPTRGMQLSFLLEATPIKTLTHYWKFLGNYSGFTSAGNTVFGFKLKGGYMQSMTGDNYASFYMPVERQFFAGGANSVRGWPARRLRYHGKEDLSNLSGNYLNLIQDYIGNRGLLEISGEMRYRFPMSEYLNEFMNYHLNATSVVAFVDAGNAFNWLAFKEYNNNLPLSEYINNIALAAGLGIRYDTPFGPIRMDLGLPIYGPFGLVNNNIFNVDKPMSYLQLHLGLGQAF